MTLQELHDRLGRAEDALKAHARNATSYERSRLEGKANGVHLALTYVEEMLRAESRPS